MTNINLLMAIVHMQTVKRLEILFVRNVWMVGEKMWIIIASFFNAYNMKTKRSVKLVLLKKGYIKICA